MKLIWLGHSSFRIESEGRNIYIDPVLDPFLHYPLADLVLISHWHFGHSAIQSVEQLRKEDTKIYGTREAAKEIVGCIGIKEGDEIELNGIHIFCLPAFQDPLKRKKRLLQHERGFALGFLITLENKKIYFVGDSEIYPGIEKVKADILLVPVSGISTMDPAEAAQLAHSIKPAFAIPMHWGKFEGSKENAERFKELVESWDTSVIIPEVGKEINF